MTNLLTQIAPLLKETGRGNRSCFDNRNRIVIVKFVIIISNMKTLGVQILLRDDRSSTLIT